MTSEALYFYAVSRDLGDDWADGLLGIGDRPVRVLQHERLAAVVSDVDLTDFGEEALARNLEDLAWLERVALAHDRVTRHVAERAPTAPLRLATVFLGETSLRERLEEWSASVHQALDRVEGRSEWSVKGYVDPGAVQTAADEPAATTGGGTGTAYLMRRRSEVRRREDAARAWAEAADRFHGELAATVVLAARLAPQDPRLSGHTGEMVLNGTYLVDHADADGFRERVTRLAASEGGLRVEIGGPWPPYSFASLETTRETSGETT